MLRHSPAANREYGYQPRNPEENPLYKLIAAHLETFLARQRERGRAAEFGAVHEPRCGAVSFIQRFGSALDLNVHIHAILLDGIYAADDEGQPQFQVLPAPDDSEIVRLTTALAERMIRFLSKRGLGPETDPEESDPLSRDEPWLARLYAASVAGRTAFGPNAGRRTSRTGDQIDPESMDALASPRCATVNGFSLHANVALNGADRKRLERLFRYCARPPVAVERLETLPDGRFLYRLKRPWRDGTTHVIFHPQQLLEKLSALVPAPRAHMVRYSGVFAPASAWRALVVPSVAIPGDCPQDQAPPQIDALLTAGVSPATSLPASPGTATVQSGEGRVRARNYTWSELMKRVWELDALECPRCHGRMRILASIHPPVATRRILECIGLPSRAPPIARAVLSDTTAS